MALAFLPSCTTFIGKAYENTTGRYNSYYLSKEKMKEVDVALKAQVKDDYHRILSIHYPSDSNFGKSQNAALEDIFKYSSWSIRFHKTSKWADNCYILIGKVRHYQYNYKDGLETFKYVNTTSKDINDRHEALIQMMKFFTDFHEMDNVKYVIDFLDGEESLMTKKNKRNYLVAKASYYQITNDYGKVRLLLDTVIPMCRRKHDKARLSFINGQVKELLKAESDEGKVALDFDADKEAYKNYKTTTGANPKYELWFNAKMNMMRVSPFSDLKDREKARKYYNKLLVDLKNVDYKDRIYYDFAGFERKIKNYPKAAEYYKLSVKNANSNQRQKAYAYLGLAEMYYDDQQKFEDAKLYYDSTITILPKDQKGYGKIYRRQRILKDFVEHLTTIKTQDSLQRLAKMDSVELDKLLTSYKNKEEKRLKQEAERLAKEAKKKQQSSDEGPFSNAFAPAGAPDAGQPKSAGFNTGQPAAFYFYSKEMAAQGKLEFQQKWGSRRKRLDYWRVSAIEVEDIEGQSASMPDSLKLKGDTSALSKKTGGTRTGGGDSEDPSAVTINKDDLYKTIPFSEEDLKASNDKLQTSLFKIGKIYDQHLNEKGNAVKSLQRLIDDFPENENVPEAHYIIYLINRSRDSLNSEEHKRILLEKYPKSLYAKILLNPNYLAENKILNKEIMARYKVGYEAYVGGRFNEADSLFTLLQSDYPENDYDPKIEIIRAIMKGRQGKKPEYRSDLDKYLEKYPSGPYHDYAMALKGKLTEVTSRKLNSEETGFVDDTTSSPAIKGYKERVSSPVDSLSNQPQDQQNVNPAQDAMPDEIKKMMEDRMRGRSSKGQIEVPTSAPDTSGNGVPKQVVPEAIPTPGPLPLAPPPTPAAPIQPPSQAPIPSPVPSPSPLDTNRKGF